MITIQLDEVTGEIVNYTNDITFDNDKKTIKELIMHWEEGNLNLNPVFQRESVWRDNQRKKLIRSIYENIPIPSIFLYERIENNRTVYDVIDGKQRLESIFRYIGVKGFKRKSFSFIAEWMEDGDYYREPCSWKELIERDRQKILTYPIQTTIIKEVDQTSVSEIFVRINSTGSKLTPQEIRNAKYLKSPFLLEIHRIGNTKWIKNFLSENRILGTNRIQRQKHIELISELILSINNGGPLNKKKAIEDAMQSGIIRGNHLAKLSTQFKDTIKLINKVFPNLRSTRFTGLADFYTLFVLVWKWKYQQRLSLKSTSANRLAEDYLISFSDKIDMIREKQRKLEKLDDSHSIYSDYLRTVQSATDEITQRRKREQILDNLLRDCFAVKDPYRTFNKEQRRLIWNNSNKRCKVCNAKLSFNSFHADHIKPHSRGGRTSLRNAQVLCAKHNIQKSDK